MNIKELRTKKHEIELKIRELRNKAANSNNFEELKKINSDTEEYRKQSDKIEDDIYSLEDDENQELKYKRQVSEEVKGDIEKRGSRIGPLNPIGMFYSSGYQQTNQEDNTLNKEKRSLIFMGDEKRNTLEYREAFFNFMQGKPVSVEQRDLITSNSGTAVIPTQTFSEIIENIQKQPGILAAVRTLTVPGKLTIPQSDINTAAQWHVEGTTISDSNKSPNNVTLGGYELAKLFSLSVATQSMSMGAFESYLIQELQRCLSIALDTAILNGTGSASGQPTGILSGMTWDSSNSKTYKIATAFTDLISSMTLLSSNFRQNAAWILNSTTLYGLLSQVNTQGNPIFTPSTAASPVMTLLGKQIIVDDYMPDDTILFGDPQYYFLNFSQQIQIARDTSAGFTNASIIYRALAVVDGKVVAPAFIKLTKAAS